MDHLHAQHFFGCKCRLPDHRFAVNQEKKLLGNSCQRQFRKILGTGNTSFAGNLIVHRVTSFLDTFSISLPPGNRKMPTVLGMDGHPCIRGALMVRSLYLFFMEDIMANLLITFPATDDHKKLFASIVPRWHITYSRIAQVDAPMIGEADAIIGNVPIELLSYARHLKWLQLYSAGTDGYTGDGVLSEGTVLTNATGAYGPAVSEHMLALLLALMKNLPLFRDAQHRAEWVCPLPPVRSIVGSIVLVVGLGDLGGGFARKIHALGGYVIGVRRSETAKPDYVDELYTADDLDGVLPRADVVAITLPGVPSTTGFFSAERISRMKPGALLLNVGRGSVIDTDALCKALVSGQVGGAGLDVFDPEPLPAGHPLWNIPQAMITPHAAGGLLLPSTREAVASICLENLSRFSLGKPLINQVDLATGYKVKRI